MRIKYKEVNFSRKSLEMIDEINAILTEYHLQGYVLTLRQIYYQLVSRAIIPNDDREYKKLGKLLGNARMAGMVDWEAIEDRVRVPKIPYYVSGVPEAIQDTIDQYRLDRMMTQNNRIEVWIEKDALSSIFLRVTEKYHNRLMVNRGYSSISAMHDAYKRLKTRDKNPIILYFGDHDPSGLDMVRDVQNRLREFGLSVDVQQIALNMAQVDEYNPPPNPAKITDPRAGWYISKYGETSWELDALRPEVLTQLVTDAIELRIDHDAYKEMLKEEEIDKETLESFIEQIDD